jgi:hypothetical protein
VPQLRIAQDAAADELLSRSLSFLTSYSTRTCQEQQQNPRQGLSAALPRRGPMSQD